MSNDSIKTKADTTGANDNKSCAPLEVCTDFYPIVHVSLSIENSDNILENVIRLGFEEADLSNERKKVFLEEMEYPQLKEKPRYFVPYIRMWPTAKEDRIFKLNCMPAVGYNNCALEGDIYFRRPKTESKRRFGVH